MTRQIKKILTLVLVMMLAVQGLVLPAYAATPAGAINPAVLDGGDSQWEDASLPRSQVSLDLQNMLEADPELMAMMEKSIAAAAEINPDRETNPVQSVQDFYD